MHYKLFKAGLDYVFFGTLGGAPYFFPHFRGEISAKVQEIIHNPYLKISYFSFIESPSYYNSKL